MRWTLCHQHTQDRARPSRVSTHDRCCMHSAGSSRDRRELSAVTTIVHAPSSPLSETVPLQNLSANNPIIDAGVAVFRSNTCDESF